MANKKSRTFSPWRNPTSKFSEKIDNAKITPNATISGRNNTKLTFVCGVWHLFVNLKTQIDASVVILALSWRYLLFKTLLIPIIRVFSPRAESATFLFATMDAKRSL